MGRYKQYINKKDPIIQWIMFINAESKEVLEMLSKDVPEIEKSTDILEVMSKSEKQRMVYEAREAYLHDMSTYLEEAEERGLEKGIEKGRAETIIKLYTKKIGKLPPKLQESIRNASPSTLDLLEEKVFDTETIEEISELIEKE